MGTKNEVQAQIDALNRQVAERRNREKAEGIDEILSLMDQHSITIDQLRDLGRSGGYDDTDIKMMHYALRRRSKPANEMAIGGTDFSSQQPSEPVAKDVSKTAARWPEMAVKQRRMFNAWHKQPDSDVSRFGVWAAALEKNKFDIDLNASHEGFLAVSRQIKTAGDDESLSLFDLWCAAVKFGEVVSLAAETLTGKAAAINWLFKPCPTLQRALPISFLWSEPNVIGDQLERLLRLFRPMPG
jgi:hypothetical protein